MWYRSATEQSPEKPDLQFFTVSAPVRFNNALQSYLTNLQEFPDLIDNQIKKYENLIIALKNEQLPTALKPYLSFERDPIELARKFYTSITDDTKNKLIQKIQDKIDVIKDPTKKIPLNLGLGGTREYLDAIGRRDLLEKLDKGNRGSLSKAKAYLYDVDDLAGTKNINLIVDSSVARKAIFNQDDINQISNLLKDPNLDLVNNYLKKYKLKIYIKDNQKVIGSL
jgi:hypothetical protein